MLRVEEERKRWNDAYEWCSRCCSACWPRGKPMGSTVTGGKASVLPSMQSSPSLPPDPRAAAGCFALACIVFSHRFGSAMLWHAFSR